MCYMYEWCVCVMTVCIYHVYMHASNVKSYMKFTPIMQIPHLPTSSILMSHNQRFQYYSTRAPAINGIYDHQ